MNVDALRSKLTMSEIKDSATSHVEMYDGNEARRKEARRQLYVRRRRAWLWRPLASAGAAMLLWQVTSGIPTPALVFVGLFMVLPWIVDC